MKSIFIYALDECCIRRILDAKKICDYFYQNAYKIVNKPEDAEIIILFTCATFNEFTKNALRKVKELQKYDAELIVAGCVPEADKEELAKIFNGKTISTKDLDKIDNLFPENKIKFSSINDANITNQIFNQNNFLTAIKKVKQIDKIYNRIKDHVLRNIFGEKSAVYSFFGQHTLYNVRISWGCLGNCSYCAIKKAIGPFHSKPLNQCIQEFRNGLNEGYKNFTINADDTGAYGKDINSNFPELLDRITRIHGDYKLIIQQISPMWVIKYADELEEILKRDKIAHLGIPFQSGSSRVLKLMHRYSDIEKMKDTILRLKKSAPDIVFTTQCILGFPTETEEEFRQTLLFIKEIDFSGGFIFRFSCKSGSEAENLEPKVSRDEMNVRIKYAKKFLKNAGYYVKYIPKHNFFLFSKQY